MSNTGGAFGSGVGAGAGAVIGVMVVVSALLGLLLIGSCVFCGVAMSQVNTTPSPTYSR